MCKMKKNKEIARVTPASVPVLATEIYQRALNAALSRSKSENTIRAYNEGIASFLANGGQIPCDAMTVATWLESATTENGDMYSIASLELYLSAIAAAHRSLSFPDPTDDPLVRETIKALRKERGTKQKQARPLLLVHLNRMCRTFTSNTSQDIRDHALLMTGWVCALRRSEISAIQMQHLTRHEQGFALYIPFSKTDQSGEGWTLPIPKASKSDVCPFKLLAAYIKLLKSEGITDGFLFRQISKSGKVARDGGLSGHAINQIVANRSALAGVRGLQNLQGEHVGFTGHSMRAGFITEGAKKGLPDWMLQATSRHSSVEMLHRYIRAARLFEDSAAKRLIR
jgi:integrase